MAATVEEIKGVNQNAKTRELPDLAPELKELIVEDNSQRQSRSFVFTKFFKGDNEETDPPIWDEGTMDYMCFQIEIAPKTGHYHYQGFVMFKKRKTKKSASDAVGNEWGSGDYIAIARGSPNQCIEYCSKKESALENSFEEYGKRPAAAQGNRTDLQNALSCKTLREAVRDFPEVVARYPNGIKTVFSVRQEVRSKEPLVWVFWGDTGTGKSKAAMAQAPLEDTYVISGDQIQRWWPNYTQQKVCVIDEFDPRCMPMFREKEFLRLLDRYPMTVEDKGSHVQFNSPHIIITSKHHPKTWINSWKDLERRITLIRRFRGKRGNHQNRKPIEDEVWDD